MLLILTSKTDLAADYLIVELARRGLKYFRINAEDIEDSNCSFELGGRDIRRKMQIGPRALDLDEISAVWYRRAIQPSIVAPYSAGERRFLAGELRHLVTGLVLNPNIRWVNRIDQVYVAEHKLLQLRLANELGFRIPRTLVSGDEKEIEAFVAGNEVGTVCKPIFHGLFTDDGDHYAVYTRRVTADSFDAETLRACPVLLQEEIPRGVDVRATFVGSRHFVADIIMPGRHVDWRDPDIDSQYQQSSLSDDEIRLCKSLLDELGLLYGAFDFIRKPNGELYFLEVNPTGEWAWLEESLDFPIRDAFVELFYGEAAT